MAADTLIQFDISLDLGKIKTAVSSASKKVNEQLTVSFSKSARKCQTACDSMAESMKEIDAAAEEIRKKIDAVLNNYEKSAKSKASSIAWIYRKQGMSQSEAMKKAWAEIERTTSHSSGKVKKSIFGIGKQAKETSEEIKTQGQEAAERISSRFTSSLKKIGTLMTGAFATKQLLSFGAECIELGSDLQEIQNVINVTFPRMNKQIDSFAQNAVASFGLSETMAKKFTGTFGAMAKAFGFNEQAAYEMSTALTGLSGDIASFYNISQDEAFTKLKSVFTGETESLKDLGVVMTQAALDQYALANGYGKTTNAMSEAEKVALRYKFVTEQLSLASGDFIRTSDGWANQVRVLKLQFDSLKATIGQGLIAVLTPVIKVINTVIGKLLSMANAVKSVFAMFGGGQKDNSAAQAAGMEAVAAAADNATTSMGGAGSAAKKAAKDINSATTGIDELNIIQPPDSGSGGSGGAAGGGYQVDEFDLGEVDPAPLEEIDNRYQSIVNKAKELAGLFSTGFKVNFDFSVLNNIEKSINGISKSLVGIFTDKNVISAADNMSKKIAYSLGRIIGSAASIGMTVADLLFGSIDLYLQQNSQRIKDSFVSLFDITAEVFETAGQISDALAVIFSAFQSESAKQIGADILGIFSGAFFGVSEIAAKFGQDVFELISQPIIQNQDKFKTALENTFSSAEPIFTELKNIVDTVFGAIKQSYDSSVKPVFDSFTKGVTEIAGKALDAYNQYIVPVIDGMSERFQAFSNEYLNPLIEKFLEFSSKTSEAIIALWENFLKPFATWFIDTMFPVIAEHLSAITDSFFEFFEKISEILGYTMDALGGLMDFITGIFTGNWKKAWEGIKAFFEGRWKAMESLLILVIQSIYNWIVDQLNLVQGIWEKIWNQIEEFFSSILENISNTAKKVFDNILLIIKISVYGFQTSIKTALDAIKTNWNTIWEGVSNTTKKIFDGIWGAIKGAINNILSGVETMANGVVRGINKMIDALNELSFDVPDWVPEIGGETFGLNIPNIPEISLPRLAQGGFVRANTPQLAMIGDNRHYGEVVAPEDKMQEMVNRAVAISSRNDGMSDQYLMIMIELLQKIIDLIENMDLTVNIDIREIKKKLVDLEKRSGHTLRTT